MGKAPSGSLPESVYESRVNLVSYLRIHPLGLLILLTGMADTCVIDLYPDLMRFWWGDFDILDSEILAGLPSYGSLFRRLIFGNS